MTDLIAKVPVTRILLEVSLLSAVCSALVADQPPSGPNVVLILSDDQGWRDYGFMGHDTNGTVVLRLARGLS